MSRPTSADMAARLVEIARAYGQEAAARADERFRYPLTRKMYTFAVQNVEIEQRGRHGVRITVRGLRAELWAREIIGHIVTLAQAETSLTFHSTDVDACASVVSW